MLQTNYNPDVLTCLANLSNDEVFTPPGLVNEILDLLPRDLWSNPDAKFLDPVCKSGVFLREMAKRLDKGLETRIPDKHQRINHIFKNQLYGIAITELTSLLSRRSTYGSKTANGKYSFCETFTDVQGNIRYEQMKHNWQNGNCTFCDARQEVYDRDAQSRIAEQLKTARLKYKIVYEESAMRNDGSSFTDHHIHRYLRKLGFQNPEGEWFKCTVKDIKAAVWTIKSGEQNEENRTLTFIMRPEQENAKELFEAEGKKEIEFGEGEGMDYFDEEMIPITTNHYLYLSGTPFRAIASGEFIEEQIFNWTYSDEQKSKENWKSENNPYASLPRMVMLTYQLPDSIREIAMKGEFNEFDLNVFFTAEGESRKARFKYEDEVQKWLDLIRGSFSGITEDNLKMGAKKPPLPFSHAPLLKVLNHTFWFLPTVASCHAMANLLKQRQNKFYHDYSIVVAAGTAAGIGVEALPPVFDAMTDNPLESKTITLSCGKLTTGVTVKPWTGIFMLRNSSSPETYFQAAFRVQSPWTIKNPDNKSPNKEEILKEECYVFDFAPNRTLRQIQEYSINLNINESNPEKKVEEFIHFLPVLAFDGSSMHQLNAGEVLDMALSGTTATLLVRRWESALLVNVNDTTLARLMKNEEAMKALMSIEGFRNLNQDIETIINKSEAVKKVKNEANERELSKKEKKELTEEEKEYKSLRKQIQDKLIKFATRVPVFMYLTDFRERSLKDVITQLEPGLFKKVTGLTVKDFELLVSLGVFNSALMNDAVYKFKRYEDASLQYIGINKHEGENIGLYDTVLSRKEYDEAFVNEP